MVNRIAPEWGSGKSNRLAIGVLPTDYTPVYIGQASAQHHQFPPDDTSLPALTGLYGTVNEPLFCTPEAVQFKPELCSDPADDELTMADHSTSAPDDGAATNPVSPLRSGNVKVVEPLRKFPVAMIDDEKPPVPETYQSNSPEFVSPFVPVIPELDISKTGFAAGVGPE